MNIILTDATQLGAIRHHGIFPHSYYNYPSTQNEGKYKKNVQTHTTKSNTTKAK